MITLIQLEYIINLMEISTYPLAFEVLLIALKGAGSYLLIFGFILPQVYLNSSSCCY